MKRFVTLLSILILFGCSKPEKSVLTGFDEFQVLLYTTPSVEEQDEAIRKAASEAFLKLGKVDTSAPTTHPPILFLSVGGFDEIERGSIRILAEVKVKKNEFNTVAPIWSRVYLPGGIAYPVVEDGKVSIEKEPEKSLTPVELVEKLIDEFADAFENANPEGTRPTFHLELMGS